MKKTISFVTRGLNFDGHTLNKKALGGSESAMIYIAKELAKLDNEVTVYCVCDNPGIYDNVEYRHFTQFGEDEKAQPDVLIISRSSGFFSKKVDSKLDILWCHDIHTENISEVLGIVENIFCLSEYQKSIYTKEYNILDPNIFWKTSNGYDADFIVEPLSFDEKKNNFIYSSRPERGLFFLLKEIWPRIVQKNPEAKLHLCGYYYNDESYENEIEKNYKINIHEIESVVNHGPLTKKEYYELLSTCAYMLYPTDFPETSCINAIEAQSLNCLVITTDDFALKETVKTNTKISSKYGSFEYINDFLELIDNYKDDNYNNEVALGKKLIEPYSWRNIATQWNTHLDNLFINRHNNNKDKIIKRLHYNSDIVAAWKLTNDSKYRQLLDVANSCNNTTPYLTKIQTEDQYLHNGRGLPLLNLIENKIKQNPGCQLKILDIGSNDGVLSLPIIKRFKHNIQQLVLYDGCKEATDHVKDKFGSLYPQLQTINDNIDNLKNYNFQFDIVIIGELLEHIEDTTEFLSTLNNLIDSETLFYFTVPKGPWENCESVRTRDHDINHVHHFELNDIKHIFKNTNISIHHNNLQIFTQRGEILGHWLFWFSAKKENKLIFETVDYNEKYIKTRPYKSISCCMIVKNEEDNISKCLKSVVKWVDEIIIVDTGSTDDTKYICKKFTDKIYDLQWEEEDGLGNFARARNYSIEKASGDYIFYIDADEEVVNHQEMLEFIKNNYYDSILLKQKNCYLSDSLGSKNDIHQDRLFRNDGINKFTGIIHEYVTRNNSDFIKNGFFQNYTWIVHYGNINVSKKIKRNSSLIHKNLKLHPDRLLSYTYLITDHIAHLENNPNAIKLIYNCLDIWYNKIIASNDIYIIRATMNHIQKLYYFLNLNQIKINGIIPQKMSFTNEKNQFLEFFVFDNSEIDLFLKHMSI